jgi:hypothetical protein
MIVGKCTADVSPARQPLGEFAGELLHELVILIGRTGEESCAPLFALVADADDGTLDATLRAHRITHAGNPRRAGRRVAGCAMK